MGITLGVTIGCVDQLGLGMAISAKTIFLITLTLLLSIKWVDRKLDSKYVELKNFHCNEELAWSGGIPLVTSHLLDGPTIKTYCMQLLMP